MRAKRGFTLVEILIVVVILGILAAIVVPQFTQASTEAKLNSLASDLHTLRSQIQLYRTQHNDQIPALADLTALLLETSDVGGTASGTDVRDPAASPPVIYGPYLERIPTNPFNDLDTIVAWGAGGGGWEYDAANGKIRPGDGGTTNDTVHADL